MSKVYYSLPDFFNYKRLNLKMADMKKQRPDWFREGVVLDSVYGTFPGIIWNGGRVQHGHAGYDQMVETIEAFNRHGISVRYTFTNCNINESHFGDTYGNLALRAAAELSGRYKNADGEPVCNGVNINVPEFGEYVRERYPQLYRMWSTTKEVRTVEEANELSRDTLLVLPYSMNNTAALERLTHPENIEILCSEICVDNCPLRQVHYQHISDLQMGLPAKMDFQCPNDVSPYYYSSAMTRNSYVSPEAVYDRYLPLGIDKFKLNGRSENVVSVIERYVSYLIAPEKRDEIRNRLLVGELILRK